MIRRRPSNGQAVSISSRRRFNPRSRSDTPTGWSYTPERFRLSRSHCTTSDRSLPARSSRAKRCALLKEAAAFFQPGQLCTQSPHLRVQILSFLLVGCGFGCPVRFSLSAEYPDPPAQGLLTPLRYPIRRRPIPCRDLAQRLFFLQHFPDAFRFERWAIGLSPSASRSTDLHAILLSSFWGSL